jgi:hypothetical protein
MVVPKKHYAGRIGPLVLEQLELYSEPVNPSEFGRSPDPPLQRYAAGIEQEGNLLTVFAMQRLHGGHAGTGETWRVKRREALAKLPRVILQALGERPEDIRRMLSARELSA